MSERLCPKGKLDIAAAPDLMSALSRSGEVDLCLDLGEVSSLGALFLQSILAARRQAQAAGKQFTIENVPDPVVNNLAAMGFTPEGLAGGTA